LRGHRQWRNGIAIEIDGDKGLLTETQDPFQFSFRIRFQNLVQASAVVSFSSFTAKSTTETLGVGTRIAIPSIFPFNSGMTRERAVAAPVVVESSTFRLLWPVADHCAENQE